ELGDAQVSTRITVRWFHTGARSDGSEPDTVTERRQQRAIRGRLVRQDCTSEDGAVFDGVVQDWEVVESAGGSTVTPRLRRTTRSVFEQAEDAETWIVTEQLAWDAAGNVVEAVEQSFRSGVTDPIATLRTSTQFSTDASGRFRQRVSRVRQEDGAGNL